MNEEQLHHGGITSTPDERDYQYSDIASASAPFDWSVGYDIEEKIGKLPVKDQGQTSACGGFAWASLSYVLDQTNREEKSEKFIYAHTHAPGGGSAGRTNCVLCATKGVSSKALCPLPNPLIEAEIERTDDITPEAYADALTNKEKSYLAVSCIIDAIAQALRDNSGVVIGLSGQNNGTWLSAYPLPPVSSDVWRHWLFVGKTRLINGKKYIGFLNSWGEAVGEKGWQFISEDYFTNNYIWEAWTMAYDAQIAQKFVFTQLLKLGSTGLDVKMLQIKLGITSDGIFGKHTKQAVINFQLSHGLVGDGVVGKLTNNELNK